MKENMETNFVKMCKQGIVGAFMGIIGGTILGLFIFLLQFPLNWLSTIGHNVPAAYYQSYNMWQSAAQPGTVGACFGAIIGAIFGCILSLKETPKKQ